MTRRPNVVETVLKGLLLSLSALLVIGQGTPSHSISSFQNLPARFLFFDDTDVSILWSECINFNCSPHDLDCYIP